MDFNSMVFPRPKPSYKAKEYKNELIWIPRKKDFSYREILKYKKNLITNRDKSMEQTKFTKSQYILTSKNFPFNDSNNYESTGSEIGTGTIISINKIPNISFEIKNKFFETQSDINKIEYIPCLFMKTNEGNKKCDKIIIYFHANYEDLGHCHNLLYTISQFNRINVLAVEYPGYGIYGYGRQECSSDLILRDAEVIYNFLNAIMQIKEENIIIMGRCIGSGPAVHLSVKYNPKSLILLSAFTSVKDAVKSIFKKYTFGWIFEKFVKDRFNNIDEISKVKCPILFIHGKQDNIIPWVHSYHMMLKCSSPAKLITPKAMDHNKYDTFKDIIYNIKDFFSIFIDEPLEDSKNISRFSFRNSFSTGGTREYFYNLNAIDFPEFMFDEPTI